VFGFRDRREGGVRVDVAFTDSTVDLQELGPRFAVDLPRVEEACGVRFARLRQVHGDDVLTVEAPVPGPQGDAPAADALVTATRGTGLMIRVADCVPVLLADPDAGVVGAVHAGRSGLVLGIVDRAVERLRDAGATRLVAWVGPHVCGGCYEVPQAMRAEVSAVVPAAYAETTWGTPALDIGAGVRSQLVAGQVDGIEVADVVDVARCTVEDDDLYSYRRQGRRSGRLGGLVWMRP
jgi:YfiH family protein